MEEDFTVLIATESWAGPGNEAMWRRSGNEAWGRHGSSKLFSMMLLF